jgi:uncharacterized protein YndB with AHSA1/START domain/DNA-binding transcriptional ArsR family regulator
VIHDKLAPVLEQVGQSPCRAARRKRRTSQLSPTAAPPLTAQILPEPREGLFLREALFAREHVSRETTGWFLIPLLSSFVMVHPFEAAAGPWLLTLISIMPGAGDDILPIVEYQVTDSPPESPLDRVYGAIADPTRRAILEVLAGGDVNVGSLAGRFPISFNGVSKHVKVLERARLVERTIQGREHRLRLNAGPLREAALWLEHYRVFCALSSVVVAPYLQEGSATKAALSGIPGAASWEVPPVNTPDLPATVLVTRRLLPVPRERVFAAWLDPVSLAQWMRPGDVARATVEVDPRVGGRFRIVMTHGQRDDEHTGEYLVIEPPALLSFTWLSANTDWLPTIVTVEFLERGAGTELVLTHRRLPATKVDAHRKGWTDIIETLAVALSGHRSG